MAGSRSPGPEVRVAYWNNQPSPYFVDRLNKVNNGDRVRVQAWFDVHREPDRSWEVDESTWRFEATYLSKVRLFRRSLSLPLEELQAVRPDLLVLTLDRFDHALGAVLAFRYSGRVAVRYLPSFDAWSRRTWWGELAKHVLYRSLDGAKVPGPAGFCQLRRYGMPAGRIVPVSQGIDVEAFRDAACLPAEVRAARRNAEGLTGTVFIFVGRLWDGKGVPTLLDAFRRLDQEWPGEAMLLLLGDGVDERKYRAAAQDLPNVRFCGFVGTEDVPYWYAAADVLVFPTLGDPHGLVVEEAMAAGLPVIATDSAGDIERRVRHNVDGLIVKAGDVGSLQSAMRLCVFDPGKLSAMKANVRKSVTLPTLDRYASDFETFVSTVMDRPPRKSWERGVLQLGSRSFWLLIRLSAFCRRCQRFWGARRSSPQWVEG